MKPPLLRVRDWARRFENSRTRELRSLAWLPVSTDLSGDTYTAVVDHPDGAAHFGVSIGLYLIGSKSTPRGDLRRENGEPHTSESLARVLRMPHALVESAIKRLLEIGDLETVNSKSPGIKRAAWRRGATTPHDAATLSPEGAEIPPANRTEQKESSSSNRKNEEKAANDGVGTEPRASKSVTQLQDRAVIHFESQNRDDDDGIPPEQKLFAMFEENGEVLTTDSLQRIREHLEVREIGLKAYVEALVPKLKPNGHIISATAIALDLAKKFGSKTTPARIPRKTKPEAPKCPNCKGAGMVRAADEMHFVPCECAPESYKVAWAEKEAERTSKTEREGAA